MPKVSVVMPVYNTQEYVGEAIESILNQTFTDFEFIIIDDGSTDKSWEIIQGYAQKDERIKALQNEENKGLVFTRNRMLEYINPQSDYVGICDADDTLTSNRLAETVSYMEDKVTISVVGVDIVYIDADGKEFSSFLYPKSPQEKKRVAFRRSPLSHGGSLIRIADWKKIGFSYNIHFKRAHDYELRSRFIGNRFKIAGIDQGVRSHHRITGGDQGKRKHLKTTLKNSIRIQRSLYEQYKILPHFTDVLYMFCELVLLVLPSSLVFWLFKRVRGVR